MIKYGETSRKFVRSPERQDSASRLGNPLHEALTPALPQRAREFPASTVPSLRRRLGIAEGKLCANEQVWRNLGESREGWEYSVLSVEFGSRGAVGLAM
jgi:hypothetical protein